MSPRDSSHTIQKREDDICRRPDCLKKMVCYCCEAAIQGAKYSMKENIVRHVCEAIGCETAVP